MPIKCWDFSYEYKTKIVQAYLDFERLKTIAKNSNWDDNDLDFETNLKESVVIVTDSKQSIVFASGSMIEMNGFSEQEVLGKSPKMFHGKETCQKISNEIRLAIQQKVPFEKTVLNYKKNGKIYYCNIKGFPVFNIKGDLVHFVAIENAA